MLAARQPSSRLFTRKLAHAIRHSRINKGKVAPLGYFAGGCGRSRVMNAECTAVCGGACVERLSEIESGVRIQQHGFFIGGNIRHQLYLLLLFGFRPGSTKHLLIALALAPSCAVGSEGRRHAAQERCWPTKGRRS